MGQLSIGIKALVRLDDTEIGDTSRANREDMDGRAERLIAAALQAWAGAILRGVNASNVQQLPARVTDPAIVGPMRDALIAVLQSAAEAGVDYGQEVIEGQVLGVKFDNPQGLFNWELANEIARRWAIRYGSMLIKDIAEVTRQAINTEVAYFVDNSLTINQLRDRITDLGAFGEARARRIAVTEVTRAYAEGNLQAWANSGVAKKKRWNTAVDELVCPICAPLHRHVVATNELFAGLYHSPPAHPNCRCSVTPVVDVPDIDASAYGVSAEIT